MYCVTHAVQKMPKYHNFDHLTFYMGFYAYPVIPLTDAGQCGKRQKNHGLCLHAKFHLTPFVLSPSRNEKLQH